MPPADEANRRAGDGSVVRTARPIGGPQQGPQEAAPPALAARRDLTKVSGFKMSGVRHSAGNAFARGVALPSSRSFHFISAAITMTIPSTSMTIDSTPLSRL